MRQHSSYQCLYYRGQSPSGSTAYIVRMRDQTITHLHEKIAELERASRNAARSRSTSPVKSTPRSPQRAGEVKIHRADKSEMLSKFFIIMI